MKNNKLISYEDTLLNQLSNSLKVGFDYNSIELFGIVSYRQALYDTVYSYEYPSQRTIQRLFNFFRKFKKDSAQYKEWYITLLDNANERRKNHDKAWRYVIFNDKGEPDSIPSDNSMEEFNRKYKSIYNKLYKVCEEIDLKENRHIKEEIING